MRNFWKFLDDWGTKYWWISLKFGIMVIDMKFYDIYSGFFKLLKVLDYIKFFLKNSIFRGFGDQKLKILKFRDKHFVELVILHLYWSFGVVSFKILFLTNFLTLNRLSSKFAWSDGCRYIPGLESAILSSVMAQKIHFKVMHCRIQPRNKSVLVFILIKLNW